MTDTPPRGLRLSPGAVIAVAVGCIIVGLAGLLHPYAVLDALLPVLGFGRPEAAAGPLVLAVALALVLKAVQVIVRAVRSGEGGTRAALVALTLVAVAGTAVLLPDVGTLAIGLGLPLCLVAFGARILVLARRRRPVPPRRLRGWGVAAVLGTALLLGSAWVTAAHPSPDDFYAAPGDVPDEPGQLLRSEPFTTDVPDGASGLRILYTTTRDDDRPALASAIVLLPDTARPAPVVAWAHGTTGSAQGCAPSLLEHPFEAGAMPALGQVIDAGYALVATDYVGLGTSGPHPYLIGQGEGRSVLDAVRAAHQLDEHTLSGKTVLWGHSQGGHAALWAGGLAADYAPDVDVVGVAAMAPASNLPALLDSLDDSTVGNIFGAHVLQAYADEYEDIDPADVLRPAALVPARETAGRCLSEPATLVSLAVTLAGQGPIWRGELGEGALADRIADNVPTLPVEAPVLLAQGEQDTLVTPDAQTAYVQDRCAAGQAIDYRTYPGDHLSLVADDSPLIEDLLGWTAERFAGTPTADTCAR